MKEQFHISTNDSVNPSENWLTLRVGSDYFEYCIYNPDNKKLLQLKRYVFSTVNISVLDKIVEQNTVLHGGFDRIITGLDFGFSSLLPAEMSYSDATPLMYLDNADQQDHVIVEVIEEKGIANLYAVPPDILTWVVHNFPSSGFYHIHTAIIKSVNNVIESGLLRVDFSENRFTVVVYKNDKLLLAKAYNYTSPADVVFYLLKIAELFALYQEKVGLEISGLIEADSKLYKELYDYFLNITLKAADWVDSTSAFPKHYFTTLNELTICELLQEV